MNRSLLRLLVATLGIGLIIVLSIMPPGVTAQDAATPAATSEVAATAVATTIFITPTLNTPGRERTCADIVKNALDLVSQDCAETGRNKVCYGNVILKADPQPGVSALALDKPGDVANLADVERLQLSNLDTQAGVWGIAVLKVQANLPDSAPGQNVTMLMFGDVQIENAVKAPPVKLQATAVQDASLFAVPNGKVIGRVAANATATLIGRLQDDSFVRVQLPDADGNAGLRGWVLTRLLNITGDVKSLQVLDPNAPVFGPLQAFYFRSGVGKAACKELPGDGILIQTPKGAAKVTMKVNDVKITLGSTVFLQAQPGQSMKTRTLEGSATLDFGGKIQTVLPGEEVDTPLDANMRASGPPAPPQPYVAADVENLPVKQLPEPVVIAPPATETAPVSVQPTAAGPPPVVAEQPTTIPTATPTPVPIVEVNDTAGLPSGGGGSSGPLPPPYPIFFSKSFNPSMIGPGGTTTLEFDLSNSGTVTQNNIAFTDDFAAQSLPITIGPSGVLANTCGGALTAAPTTQLIQLTGGSLPAGNFCFIQVQVTSSTLGNWNNTTGSISATPAGTGGTAFSTLIVSDKVTISPSISPSPVAPGDTTTITFNLVNPNPTVVTALGFDMDFASQSVPLTVAAVPNVTSTCPGIVSPANITATAGAGIISISGGTLAANANCNITVDLTAGSPDGFYCPFTSNETATPASATPLSTCGFVQISSTPVWFKFFSPSFIAPGATSTLFFYLTNPYQTTILTNVGFTDDFGAQGLPIKIAATPNITISGCSAITAANVTAAAGTQVITLAGGTMAPAESFCSISVDVTSSTLGTWNNTTGPISSTPGGTGATASGTLTVGNGPPPSSGGGPGYQSTPGPLPFCPAMDSTTNPVVRALIPANAVTRGTVFCGILVIDTQYPFRSNRARVGPPAVINAGILQAVDVSALSYDNRPITEFQNPVKICLRGTGHFIFMDVHGMPRVPVELASTHENGYTCALIPNPGTVVLTLRPVEGMGNPVPAPPTSLTSCQVTTRAILNLRATPDINGAVIQLVPYQVTLTAIAKQGEWYLVDDLGKHGWLNERFVDKDGKCD